jgi:AhpD family alkylhydroperoxidase
MTRLEPVPRQELPQYEPIFKAVEASMGFLPSSMRTMAYIPQILDGFGALAVGVSTAGFIEPGLSQMIANVTSLASGCRYCQAHTAAHAEHVGVDAEKIEHLWEFETSELFTQAERVALRVALGAGGAPNSVTDDHFAALSEHYSNEAVVQIVGTIAMFGFLNRWNDTMATTLEDEPLAFAHNHLSGSGWEPGKHA